MLLVMKRKRLFYIMTVIVLMVACLHMPGLEQKTIAAEENAKYTIDAYKQSGTYPEQAGKVFAGWYEDTDFQKPYRQTTGEAYAKFVDASVLTVKKQLGANTATTSATAKIRFITSIDTLKFQYVGFDVAFLNAGKTFSLKETRAYTSILEEGGNISTATPKATFGDASSYFVLHSITGIPNAYFSDDITVKPYWVTLDGTKVYGETNIFTINGKLLEGTLFTDKVTFSNGTTQITSDCAKWDTSKLAENTLSCSQALGSPWSFMYFANTGKTALIHTVIDRTGTMAEDSRLTAMLAMNNGTETSFVGIMADAVRYPLRGTVKEEWGKLPYAVLASWDTNHLSVVMDIAYKDGKFYLYVDNTFVKTLEIGDLLSGATKDTELAFGFGFDVNVEEDQSQLDYTDIQFTTDAAKVNEFLVANNSLFKETVTFSDGTTQITSDYAKWDTSKLAENTLSCSDALNSSWSFMFFANTGKTALIHTVIKRTDALAEGCAGSPTAMLVMNNGTGTSFLGIMANAVRYSLAGTVKEEWNTLPYAVLANWDTNHLSVVMDIAYKDGKFYLYVDNTFVKTFEIGDLLSGATKDTELAFGFGVDLGGQAQLDYTDIQFTTDAAKVTEFLNLNP